MLYCIGYLIEYKIVQFTSKLDSFGTTFIDAICMD